VTQDLDVYDHKRISVKFRRRLGHAREYWKSILTKGLYG
jgi:hypothetical protein